MSFFLHRMLTYYAVEMLLLTGTWAISPLFLFISGSNCTPRTLYGWVVRCALAVPTIFVQEGKHAGLPKSISFNSVQHWWTDREKDCHDFQRLRVAQQHVWWRAPSSESCSLVHLELLKCTSECPGTGAAGCACDCQLVVGTCSPGECKSIISPDFKVELLAFERQQRLIPALPFLEVALVVAVKAAHFGPCSPALCSQALFGRRDK